MLSIDVDMEKCVGCYLCIEACPEEVLGFDRIKKKSVVVHLSSCIVCRNCENSCGVDAIKVNYPEWPGTHLDRMVQMV